MKTPDEIKKALKCYKDGSACYDCPYEQGRTFEANGVIFGCSQDIVADALAYIEQLEEKQQWISIKDRLPETPDTYFCCVNSLAFLGNQYVKTLKFCGNGKWWKDEDVTHWMPLPELPKEEEKP